jgi:hypothetical protein
MPKITFTQENLLERNQLEAGWYKFLVKEITEGPGKSDPTSTVYTTDFVVADGPAKNTPVKHWFTEKQMGRIVDFLKCFLGGKSAEAGREYDLSDTKGRHVMGYVKYDTERAQNVIEAFKAVV